MVLMRKNAKGVISLILAAVLFTVLLNATYFTKILLHTEESGYTAEQILGNQPYVPFLNLVTSGRSSIYQAGIHAFSEAPITGNGLGLFGQRALAPLGLPATGAHSLYLSTAIESGIAALLTICITMIYILVRYYRLSSKLIDGPNGFLAAAAYGIIIGSFFNTLIEYGVMFTSLYSGLPFWISLAVIDGLYMTSNSQEKSQVQQISLRSESVRVNKLADSLLIQD
jgi:O-antigen ligase